jgi:glycerol-3-phosphate O-acyltransferase
VYRNSAVHALLVRAVTECALQAVASQGDDALDPPDGAGRNGAGTPLAREALRLRELLKFDFFFADRDRFAVDVTDELDLLAPDEPGSEIVTADDASGWLRRAEWLVAPLVLRPFLDAYSVVADELAAHTASVEIDEKAFVGHCLQIAQQKVLQREVVGQESVSSEMLSTALRLARHRNLLAAADGADDQAELIRRRQAFADELRAVRGHLDAIAATSPDPIDRPAPAAGRTKARRRSAKFA